MDELKYMMEWEADSFPVCQLISDMLPDNETPPIEGLEALLTRRESYRRVRFPRSDEVLATMIGIYLVFRIFDHPYMAEGENSDYHPSMAERQLYTISAIAAEVMSRVPLVNALDRLTDLGLMAAREIEMSFRRLRGLPDMGSAFRGAAVGAAAAAAPPLWANCLMPDFIDENASPLFRQCLKARLY